MECCMDCLPSPNAPFSMIVPSPRFPFLLLRKARTSLSSVTTTVKSHQQADIASERALRDTLWREHKTCLGDARMSAAAGAVLPPTLVHEEVPIMKIFKRCSVAFRGSSKLYPSIRLHPAKHPSKIPSVNHATILILRLGPSSVADLGRNQHCPFYQTR